MSPSLAGVLQLVLLVAALAVCYKPLGDYIARVFMSPKHLRVEAGFYRVMGIDPEADQRWGAYARSMLAFSGVCVLFLYLLERIQHWLPYSNGQPAVPSFLAWNTAASFVTNTNWQNYSGETTMGYVVQMAGLAVQNFVSAAVGIVVVIALIRGFMRSKTDR
ncbi:MAG: potassium-transporting ATPase subunit KdpA, partial [Trebonia sp.]